MRGGFSLASLNPFKKNEKGEGGWLSGLFGKKSAPVTAGMVQPEEDASPETQQGQFNTQATASEGETTVQDETPPATPSPDQEGGKRRRRRRKSKKKRGGGCGCSSPMTGGKRKRRRRRTHKKKRKSRRRRR
tara:strand:+ start:88 stop:483 length:396 start_codon:yes stop_codon:yes gene_type:complete